MHLQLGTNDDYRTSRVIDTLTEQVLTEATLLTLQRVAQRLQRAVALALNGVALTRVVEQRIHCLLQHTLLVAQNHLGSLDLDQSLQTVVTNDHATIQIVQIRRCETTTVQRHQRAQFGRDHGDNLQDHPLGLIDAVRCAECLDHVQALQRLALTLLRGLGACLVAQCIRHRVQIYLLQQSVDCLGTHLSDKLVRIAVVQLLVALRQCCQNVQILLLGQSLQLLDTLLGSGTGLNYHVTLIVDDRLQLLRGDTQQVTDLRGQRLEVPDVNNGHYQRDVAHTLTTYLLLRNLDTASVADDTLITDTLVLTAVALVVLHRTEDALAEQTVALGLVGTIVDGFGFQHLTTRIFQNLLGRRQADGNSVEARTLIVFIE